MASEKRDSLTKTLHRAKASEPVSEVAAIQRLILAVDSLIGQFGVPTGFCVMTLESLT